MIASSIRMFRKQRGLTQEKLGRLCGMTGGAISSYENGATVPKRRVLEKIAQALEVPVERLTAEALPSEAAPGGPAAPGLRQASDALLYDGVLSVLRDLYGIVEGRVILGENGGRKKYYLVKRGEHSFILYESDIAAIVRSAKASMPPLVEHMKRCRSQRPEAGV